MERLKMIYFSWVGDSEGERVSEWEGGRQSEARKLIFTDEQTVVPEWELRSVHLSSAAGLLTKRPY